MTWNETPFLWLVFYVKNMYFLCYFLGVILLVLLYTAMGSIIFVSLEGDHSEYTNIGETAVAASKPYPRNDLENSDIRSR